MVFQRSYNWIKIIDWKRKNYKKVFFTKDEARIIYKDYYNRNNVEKIEYWYDETLNLYWLMLYYL